MIQMDPTTCDERNRLRREVYDILERYDTRNGSQAALLKLANCDEWNSFISLLYAHIRSCPICRTKPSIQHPSTPHIHPSV